MADLLALRLHQVEEAVRSIVDKAVRELGTEKVVSLGCFFLPWANSVTGMRADWGEGHRPCVGTRLPAGKRFLLSHSKCVKQELTQLMMTIIAKIAYVSFTW